MKTSTLKPTPANLRRIARLLANGNTAALPTETVYGLAANALSPAACKKIFRAKNRPANDPLIVHVATLSQAAQVATLNPSALKLAKKFWPGPLTLVLPKTKIVPPIVTAKLDSVAIRSPKNKHFQKILRLSGLPLAAPSANPFGYISPTTAAHVKASLNGKIPAILDGGPSDIGLESTILDLRDEQHPVLLRPGAITRQMLEKNLRKKITIKNQHLKKSTAASAPGQLTKHYSPRTPLSLGLPKNISKIPSTHALLLLKKPQKTIHPNTHHLTTTGNLTHAARNLFATLRHLDTLHYKKIHIQKIPATTGISSALIDRLTRAAAKK